MKATTKYNKEKQTLTISIPGLVMLPEVIWDVAAGTVTKGKGPNGQMIKIKRSSPKTSSRKKSPRRVKKK